MNKPIILNYGMENQIHFWIKKLNWQSRAGEALNEARSYHERDHLFAFSDFEARSGKKLKLVLQENPNEGIRLAVRPNRLQLRGEVRRSVRAVENPSEGDEKFGCYSRFRRR